MPDRVPKLAGRKQLFRFRLNGGRKQTFHDDQPERRSSADRQRLRVAWHAPVWDRRAGGRVTLADLADGFYQPKIPTARSGIWYPIAVRHFTSAREEGTGLRNDGLTKIARGWIYAIVEATEPYTHVKSGWTGKDPEFSGRSRRNELQAGNWRPLTIKKSIGPFPAEVASALEREAHRWLHNCAIGGEWFACTPEYAWSAVERVVHRFQNPPGPADWPFFSRPKAEPEMPDSPVHRSVAALRACGTRARKEGDHAKAAEYEARAARLNSGA